MPSLWWSLLGGPPPPRPPLPGPGRTGVAIVGGGYTGLWTAWALRRAAPGLEVTVLEAEHVGFGASGRNGGWLQGELADGTAIPEAVALVAAACAEERIECDLVQGGTLTVATNPAQLRRLPTEGRLSAAQVAARVAVDGALGGTFSPHCARIQPAKLVAGLADAVERRGARIHERTRVTAIEPGRVRTDRGELRTDWIVLATEGFTARGIAARPSLRRGLVPLNSSMLATEPLDEATWRGLGWDGAETLLDGAHRYCYLQPTADRRVAIGGRGHPYRFGSRTDTAGEVPAATVEALRRRLAALFPPLTDAPVAASWAGVLGVPRDWRPFVVADPATRIAQAGGYVGEGVAAAHLAGLALADLILGRHSASTRAEWVGRRPRRWELEPLRWLGIHTIYALYGLADREEARTGRPSRVARLAGALAGR